MRLKAFPVLFHLKPIADICIRYCHRFFDQVGHQTTYASIGNKHFFYKMMSSADLPKLRTEPTKIGHIFRK